MQKRTTNEIQAEYRRLSQRLNACRRVLETSAGYLSDVQLAGYKTAVADCQARIAALDEEVSRRSFNHSLNTF